MINIIDKQLCCGCNACVQRCPKYCITMQEDSEGFLYPNVDEETCINCGLCEKVCPMLNLQEPQDPRKVLAVKNRNEEERMKSSSGGVFILLAKHTLEKNGVVFGAVFDDNWEVRHTYAETIEGVYPMMGSKYVQSRIENSYKDAELFLKQGREVLFTGSPCQIAGLKAYLHKDYDNLLAVDFICHGVPSPGVWRRYLQELQDPSARRAAAGKNSVLNSSLNDVPEISGIEFRDKTLNGWKKYSFVVRGRSACEADKNTVLLSGIHRTNPFMKGFLSDIYLRPSCYDCQHKCGKSHSDITIADFWGIQAVMPDFDDDKGVGLVLLNSDKGSKTLQTSPNLECADSMIEIVRKFNPAYCRSPHKHPKRELFYLKFAQDKSVSDIVAQCLHVPLHIRILRDTRTLIRRIVKKALPDSAIQTIKKIRNR